MNQLSLPPISDVMPFFWTQLMSAIHEVGAHERESDRVSGLGREFQAHLELVLELKRRGREGGLGI